MAKHHDQFSLDPPVTTCIAAARTAVAALGWRITSETSTSLTCFEMQQALASGSPVQTTITFGAASDGSTQIALDGSNFGFGPFQSHHVKTQVQALRQQIELAASRAAAAPAASTAPVSRSVIVNAEPLRDDQIQMLEEMYRTTVRDGRYWYDRATGSWGFEGGPTINFIAPGLDLGGQLREDASNGTTGVFINGRQLHLQDVLGLQQLTGIVIPGRWWVDAAGNIGLEGGPMLGNLLLAARARQGAGGAWQRHSSISPSMTVSDDGAGGISAFGTDLSGNTYSAFTGG
jgi:hypothetical protein